MKFPLIAVAAALSLPLPVAAQSLDETHDLVWHPAGKTPAATYRERGTPSCKAGAAHHQAGKGAMPAKRACVVVTTVPAAPTAAQPAVAR